MTIDDKDMINSILESVSRIDYIKPEDIPNIDLYMDQVTTFMEEQLVSSKRYADDKILTKTMINNYAKNILSINDIQTLLTPITQEYFKSMTGKDMTYIYNEVFSMEKEQIESLKKDLLRKYKTAQDTFGDADEEDQANLKRFSFICLLSFDVYVKKMMIEHIIDGMNPEPEHNSKKKK